jgi:hypothetical protein
MIHNSFGRQTVYVDSSRGYLNPSDGSLLNPFPTAEAAKLGSDDDAVIVFLGSSTLPLASTDFGSRILVGQDTEVLLDARALLEGFVQVDGDCWGKTYTFRDTPNNNGSISAHSPHYAMDRGLAPLIWKNEGTIQENIDAVKVTPNSFCLNLLNDSSGDPRLTTKKEAVFEIFVNSPSEPTDIRIYDRQNAVKAHGLQNVGIIGNFGKDQIHINDAGSVFGFIDGVTSYRVPAHGFVGSAHILSGGYTAHGRQPEGYRAPGSSIQDGRSAGAACNWYRRVPVLNDSDYIIVDGPIEAHNFSKAIYGHAGGSDFGYVEFYMTPSSSVLGSNIGTVFQFDQHGQPFFKRVMTRNAEVTGYDLLIRNAGITDWVYDGEVGSTIHTFQGN